MTGLDSEGAISSLSDDELAGEVGVDRTAGMVVGGEEDRKRRVERRVELECNDGDDGSGRVGRDEADHRWSDDAAKVEERGSAKVGCDLKDIKEGGERRFTCRLKRPR
jgi:hypothetical protein